MSLLRFVNRRKSLSTASDSRFVKPAISSSKRVSKKSTTLMTLIQRLEVEKPTRIQAVTAYVKHLLERGSRAS